MPHVRDGEIHAYLDGALDAVAPENGARIRQHLDTCDDCGRRVAVQRALRDRAETILAASGPEALAPPPLEELRQRAQSGGAAAAAPRTRKLPTTVLAWAASVLLALATGWEVRDRLLDPATVAPGSRVTAAQPPIADADRPSDLGQMAEGRTESNARLEESASEVSRSAANAPATAQSGSGGAGDARRTVDALESGERVASVEAPAREAEDEAVAPPPATAASSAPEPVRQAERERSFQDAEPTPPPPGEEQRARTQSEAFRIEEPAQLRASRAEGRADAEADAGVEVAPAESPAFQHMTVARVGGAVVMLPGLAVESVEASSDDGGRVRVQVVQRLPDGASIALVFVPFLDDPVGGADATARLADVLPPLEGWSREVLPVQGGWLVARAPVPADSLAELLAPLR